MYYNYVYVLFFFFFKQKTAYEMRISDWSSDVCSSDLVNADVEYSLMVEATADGTGTATIGDVTIGAIDATLNDGATFDYSMSAYAHDSASPACIGVVSVGDISLFSTNDVSSSAGASIPVEHANGIPGALTPTTHSDVLVAQ